MRCMIMSKKNQPFREIINLAKEFKDYKALCKCKSKKYTYYDQWEKHLFDGFKKLSKEHYSNFRHFLDYYSFFEEHSIRILFPTLTAFIPLMMHNVGSENYITDVISTTAAIIIASFMIFLNYFQYSLYAKFVSDVLNAFIAFEESKKNEKNGSNDNKE